MEWLIPAAAIAGGWAVGLIVWLIGTRPRRPRPCPTRKISIGGDEDHCQLEAGHTGWHAFIADGLQHGEYGEFEIKFGKLAEDRAEAARQAVARVWDGFPGVKLDDPFARRVPPIRHTPPPSAPGDSARRPS